MPTTRADGGAWPWPGAPRRVVRVALGVAATVFLVDVVSKALALHSLEGRTPVSVLGGAAQLEIYRNQAGPSNILEGHSVLVSLLVIAAMVGLVLAFRVVRTVPLAIAFGLIFGAGLGNLLDRLTRAPGPLRGGVIDWIRPSGSHGVMNIADLMINVGVLLAIAVLVVGMVRRPSVSEG